MVTAVTLSTKSQSITLDKPMVSPNPSRKRLGPNPNALFDIPLEGEFYAQEFIAAPAIEAIANSLIGQWPEFHGLDELEIRYSWKRKGGGKGKKLTLGKCTKASGYGKFYGEADFFISISADNCRIHELTNHQMTALVYHEMKHIAITEDEKTGEQVLNVRPHDVEMFVGELERYGLWTTELTTADAAFRQLRLGESEK